MGTSTALDLSKSPSAGGTRGKVQEKFAQLGSVRSVYKGEQVRRSLCLTGGETTPFTASAALGGRTWAPKALQGSGGRVGVEPGVLGGCPAGMCPPRRGGLAHKLEILLRSFSCRSRRQARRGRQPEGTMGRRVRIAAQRPSVQLRLGGDTARRRAPCSLIRVEPTRLNINLLTAENKPPVLAVSWAGEEGVTGHPDPSAPQGGEKRETVSEPHLREIPPEFLAASFTPVAANATSSSENC